MKTISWTVLCGAVMAWGPLGQAQDASKPGDAAADQAAMMALAQPGENHKLLADGAGTWSYKVKWWMAPGAPPSESAGTCSARLVMDGRYLVSEMEGKMSMPGADGKMTEMPFKGMGTEGYDNVKKKYVASWIDNMGTGIMFMEGTYDAGAKALTYKGEEEMTPGQKTKMREVISFPDRDHRTQEFYMEQGGAEVKAMEINYSRS